IRTDRRIRSARLPTRARAAMYTTCGLPRLGRETHNRRVHQRFPRSLHIREYFLDRATLVRGPLLYTPAHERVGVHAGALATVGGSKTMVRRGGIDERRRDECNSMIEIKIVLANGYGVSVVQPRHAARYRPVASIRVWSRHILPGPEPLSTEHFIILRSRQQATVICHPVSNFILNSSPKGSCSCQFGDHLSNGGSGHEFLRRKPVAGIAGAMVVDTHPSLRQYVDALDGVDRRA